MDIMETETTEKIPDKQACSDAIAPSSVQDPLFPEGLSPIQLGERHLEVFNDYDMMCKQEAEAAKGTPQEEVKKLTFRDGYQPPHPTILIIHASVGSGHRSAAIGVAQAFEALRDSQEPAFPDGSPMDPETRIAVIDILAWGAHVYDGNKTASAFTGASRPFYDITWRYSFTGRLLWSGGTFLNYMMWRKFTRYIGHIKPLAVITTHIMAANMTAGARRICKQSFPLVCVPTDYETEGLWPHKAADVFCVATESMAETLRPRLVAEERISITGIPARMDFRCDYDTQEVRDRLGLPKDKKLVLALAGAYLPQPYVNLRATIDATLPTLSTHPHLHLVIVCGKDEEYYAHVKQMGEEYKLKNMTVMGYVTEMAQLMAASDLIICKSGGLTITECLNVSTPMLLVGRAYGQEKVNVNMLTSNGAAMHVTTARELIDALNSVDAHPERVEAMVVNANLLRKPDAALDIAKIALRLSTMTAEKRHMWNPGKANIFEFYWGDKPAHIR